MGNVVGKSKGMGYYGASREGFCYEDNTEGFVIVKASLVPSPENTYEVEEEESTGRRSPFEQVTSAETTEIAERKDLEDSGYAEAQAAAHRCRGASPEPIPVPSDQHEHHEVIQDQADFGEPTEVSLIEKDCRTARSLGKHHAYFGYRFFHYSDTDCEGNRHIRDQDL